MPRWAATVATLVLVVLLGAGLAACSDDDGGGSGEASDDPEASQEEGAGEADAVPTEDAELCAVVEQDPDLFVGVPEGGSADEDDLELLADAAAVGGDRAAAIQVIHDHLALLVAALPHDSAEDGELIRQVFGSPDLRLASEAVGTVVQDSCGIDVDLPSEVDAARGVVGEDGAIDEETIDPDGIRAHLVAADPALAGRVRSIGVVDDDGVELIVDGLPEDPVASLRLCESVSTYLYGTLGATSASIDVVGTDNLIYASRFNESADCR